MSEKYTMDGWGANVFVHIETLHLDDLDELINNELQEWCTICPYEVQDIKYYLDSHLEKYHVFIMFRRLDKLLNVNEC